MAAYKGCRAHVDEKLSIHRPRLAGVAGICLGRYSHAGSRNRGEDGIFSVVNAVMLCALPFVSPNRLVWVTEKNDKLRLPWFAAVQALGQRIWA
jgi:hypothetical protein